MLSKSLVFLFLLLFTRFVNSQNLMRQEELSSNEFILKFLARNNSIIIDLRSKLEFDNGHISDAVNYPIDDGDFVDSTRQLDKSFNIFLYCTAGGRSELALKELKNLGYYNVYTLKNGLMSWILDQKPLATAKTLKNDLTLIGYRQLIFQDKLVVVFFTANWCVPCQPMKEYLIKISQKSNHFSLVTLDIDVYPNIKRLLNIEGIPSIFMYSKGIEKWKWAGFVPENLIRDKLSHFLN